MNLALLSLSLLGWLNALYALWHRQTLLNVGIDAPSFCNISERFNCDAVALSPYGEFAGLPTSAWGMIFYWTLTMLAAWVWVAKSERKNERSSAASAALFALAAFGLLPTLVQAFRSFAILKVLCLFCLFSYAINIAIFALAWKQWRSSRAAFAPALWFNRLGKTFVSIAVVTAILHAAAPALMANSASAGRTLDATILGQILNQHVQSDKKSLNVDNAPAYGAVAASAVVTVVEYSDFQCPFCARSAATLMPLLQNYAHKVRYVYKNFPLDKACNSTMKQSMHPQACDAAKAGICVFKNQGDAAFFAYKKELFARQKELKPDVIREVALKSGLAAEALDACMKDAATLKYLSEQVAEANAIGVQGTPSLYINGRRMAYPQPAAVRTVLEHYLKSSP